MMAESAKLSEYEDGVWEALCTNGSRRAGASSLQRTTTTAREMPIGELTVLPFLNQPLVGSIWSDLQKHTQLAYAWRN